MKYISILKGINVSGQKKILMLDLKELYYSLDFENVISYIQSGNVIFDCGIKSTTVIKSKIEIALYQKYNFHVSVFIRTSKEWSGIINAMPYKSINLEKHGSIVLISFMSKKPSKVNQQALLEYVKLPDKLVIIDKQVFLFCPGGYGKSKLTNNFIEKKLQVEATTRNLKSLHKIFNLSLA